MTLTALDAMGQPIIGESSSTKDVRFPPYNWGESSRFGSGAMGIEVIAAVRVQIIQGIGKVAAEGLIPMDRVFAKLDKEGYLRHVVHVKSENGAQGVSYDRENHM